MSEQSNTVTFTITPVNDPPTISASAEIVCTGTQVTISANCPNGSTAFWNTGVTANSFQVAFSNVTKQTYWAKCIFPNGCQSPESIHKTILWKAFDLTFINIGQSKSATKPANDRNLWAGQFITPDAGPVLENSTEANPTIYYSENVNKTAPRFWTIQAETCALGTDGSVTYDMLATPEVGIVRSYNTHENNAPYLMYANREGFHRTCMPKITPLTVSTKTTAAEATYTMQGYPKVCTNSAFAIGIKKDREVFILPRANPQEMCWPIRNIGFIQSSEGYWKQGWA